ncbi:DUF7282 domain-containing protein [Haloarcula argentinensis]|uniref:Surface glycoprotein n=1 Tax=Haloarcula argentinensis TaxID=43776 RepID=A0ABU2EZX4_HALAR|nr:BGTF surface domain-containing protein [Haloarcula argentinensis]EMA18613.1 hypothetical protein C443_18994 [Haloarcula argentinensis DSM 12282]MDS0253824.1 surface glycoprotein [Haloarcula argentinensis]
MTDTSEKIRSLFLTALMVFSVFAGTIAFSGGAAAAGANVSVEQAAEYDSGTVELALNGSTGDAVDSGNITVFIDGNENPSNYGVDSVVADGTNERLEFTLDQDVQPNRNLTVKVTNLNGGAVVAEDIDVTSNTITTTKTNDTEINAFRGEVIAVKNDTANTSDNSPSIEVDGDSIVLSDSYADNSQVYTVDTSDLDTGEDYTISVANNDEAVVSISDLSLQVNIDDDVGDGANIDDTDTLAVNVSTNRGGEPANATLFDEDDDKVETIVKNLQGNDNAVFDFGNQSADDSPYYVEVTDNQTGVSAESDQINVSESDDGDASFETSTVQDELGDVANITVQMSNTEDAVINVGSQEDDNYYIQGQLTDEDGDGEVTVQFNSYTAGTDNNNTVLSVPGDDDLDDVDEGGSFTDSRANLGEDGLEPQSYSINVSAGTSPDVTSPDTVGTLRLNENSVENINTWAAPSDAEIDDDDVDIYDRIGVNLTQSDDLAAEDVVVHEIQASGIEGALEYEQEDGSASDATEAFVAATDTTPDRINSSDTTTSGLRLYVNRTDVGANADADPINFTNSSDAVTVVDDPDNNSYFVAVDTSDVTFESGDTIVDEEDTRLNATFSVRDGPLTDDRNSDSAIYTTSERDATLNLDDSGVVTVSAAAGQEVSGTTNVAPGTELEVEMESESEANPFVLRPEVEVATDGTYTAMADFSDYSAGTNFTVQTIDVDDISDQEAFSDEEDGRIVEAGTATVSISEQESTGSEVVVDSAQLSDGGFIAIHAGNASGDVVGNSKYLGAGSHEDVTITLDEPMDEDFTAVAMPHRDTNGNEAYDFPDADGPYTSNDTAVTDSANVTIVEEQTEAPDTETETEAPDTETETEEQTEETTTMDSGTDEVETTEQTGPGFTAALALIALVAAALLAVRRDN